MDIEKLTKWQQEIVQIARTVSIHTLINYTLEAAADFHDTQQGQLTRRFWKYQYLTDQLHARVSKLAERANQDTPG